MFLIMKLYQENYIVFNTKKLKFSAFYCPSGHGNLTFYVNYGILILGLIVCRPVTGPLLLKKFFYTKEWRKTTDGNLSFVELTPLNVDGFPSNL